MPRRSPEHRDARRRQILDAARRCFSSNGFHATSMQDVLTEAGLSAGAVYRYFSGKEQIVRAIAEEALGDLAGTVVGDVHTGSLRPLDEAIGEMLDRLQRLDEQLDLAPLAVQVWGEAARSPELGAVVAAGVGNVRASIRRLVERYRAEGMLDGAGSSDDVARVIHGMLAGFVMQRAVLRDVDAATFRAGIAELMTFSGSRTASRRP
jgi:AcrR family transcriptional regulator